MTTSLIGHSAEANPRASVVALPPPLTALVEQAVAVTIPPETAELAVDGDPETLASLGRAIAVQEGYLIEAIVIALATYHPDRLTLTGVRLPLLPAALDVIKRNRKGLYEGLSFDPTVGATATYHPDLVIADRRSRSALIIDVKRSLSGYLGGNKLIELQQRMTASGLVLPDVLWRDHQRLAVETVGTAIIDASKVSKDTADGVWALMRLDELLDVDQAGALAIQSLAEFRAGVRAVWQKACASAFEAPAQVKIAVSEPLGKTRARKRTVPHAAPTDQPDKGRSSVTVGPFRPGPRTH